MNDDTSGFDTAPATLAPPDADLSPAPARQPFHWQLLQFASTYLPVMLMALLALGTWWLVKNTVQPGDDRPPTPPRHEPDYVMNDFSVQRYSPAGTLEAQIEGGKLRHYPDDDTLEIDDVRLRMVEPDGRVSVGSANQAITDDSGSEVQLLGDARLLREGLGDDPAIQFRGDFLHAFVDERRVTSNKPVAVTQGGTVLRADGMQYTHEDGVVRLQGRTRAIIEPRERRAPPAPRP